MLKYTVRQINISEYDEVRILDRDAFGKNERGSSADFHEVFADRIRSTKYFIPELDLLAVTEEGLILGHGIFSRLPAANGMRIIILNSLAVRHGENDSHPEKRYEFQRKGIGSAIVKYGLEKGKSMGFMACVTCGNPAVYRDKMGFVNFAELGITKGKSITEPYSALFVKEITPGGFAVKDMVLDFPDYGM